MPSTPFSAVPSLRATIPARPLTTVGLLIVLSTAFMAAACAGDERPGDDRFTVTVEDGVTVAQTTGGPLFNGDLFTLEPLLTLRQDPEEPESLLFRATSFHLGPDGRYYVSDYGNSRIAVYDAEGRFEQAMGRRGDGPGEFYQPYLQSLHDGVVSAFDFNHQRESRFDPAGRLLETVRLPGGGLTIGIQRLPGTGILCYGVNAREENEVGWTGRTLTLLTSDGTDTLWTLATGQVPENRLSRIQVADGSWSTLSVDMPFPPTPTAQWIPGQGFLLAEGDHPELRWYDLEGRLTRRVLFEPPVHELTDAVKRQYEERLWQLRVENARRRGREPQPVGDMVYPDRPGIWSWSVLDGTGNVWLLDTWSEELGLEEDRGHRFHVVAADGRYLGTTLAPVSRITLSGDRLLAAVEDEESGEVDFTVFRLVPALPGLVYP